MSSRRPRSHSPSRSDRRIRDKKRSRSRSYSRSPQRSSRRDKRRSSSPSSNFYHSTKPSPPRSTQSYSTRTRDKNGDHGSNRNFGRQDQDRDGRGWGKGRRGRDGNEREQKYEWGGQALRDEEEKKKAEKIPDELKEKVNFEPTGALAAETNTVNGVVVKYNEPPEAKKPGRKWRLYVYKDGKEIDLLHIHRQSAFLMGRDRNIADIPLDHPSCSKQHAVLQYRQVNEVHSSTGTSRRITKPFIIDLESVNGVYVNSARIPVSRYYEIQATDMIKFGESTREYVLMDAGPTGEAE